MCSLLDVVIWPVSPVEISSSSPRRQKPITLVFVAPSPPLVVGARNVSRLSLAHRLGARSPGGAEGQKRRPAAQRPPGSPSPPRCSVLLRQPRPLGPAPLRVQRPYPSGLRPAPRPGRRWPATATHRRSGFPTPVTKFKFGLIRFYIINTILLRTD